MEWENGEKNEILKIAAIKLNQRVLKYGVSAWCFIRDNIFFLETSVPILFPLKIKDNQAHTRSTNMFLTAIVS